jgi:hypothetical protein
MPKTEQNSKLQKYK